MISRMSSAQSLQQVAPTESKVVKEKVVKTLELCLFLVKHVQQQVGGGVKSFQGVLLMWFWSSLIVVVCTSRVEAVGGPGGPQGGAAKADQHHHLQQDGYAGGHLLGRDEALWSHVS